LYEYVRCSCVTEALKPAFAYMRRKIIRQTMFHAARRNLILFLLDVHV